MIYGVDAHRKVLAKIDEASGCWRHIREFVFKRSASGNVCPGIGERGNQPEVTDAIAGLTDRW